jgi:hypothetical protein
MDTHKVAMAIEDHGTPKALDDPTLSPRAQEIARQVEKSHARWLRLAAWGRDALGRDPKTLNIKEAMAVQAYADLCKKVTWPLWSTKMDDEAVKSLVFAIQATCSRVARLVPEVFA